MDNVERFASSTERHRPRGGGSNQDRGRLVLALAFVVSLCASLAAQIPSRGTGPGRGAGVPGELTVDAVALGPVDAGPPVKGAPYSADAITEIVQPLVDGNRIVRRTRAMVFRDSRGWTRREVMLGDIAGIVIAGQPVRSVTIVDPDSGVTYVAEGDHEMIALGKPEPGEPIGAGRASPPLATRARGMALPEPLRTTMREESLGSREIEGVRVEGTRRTITIPAGAIGNERPIASVTERWFSPDLRVVILSRQLDPRFGETTYRLTGIVRSEPPARLFDVSAAVTLPRPR